MKKYITFKISYVLTAFFLGVGVFVLCSILGAIHAASAISVQTEVSPVVVIDAGHGGEDGGAIGENGIMEKDINLAVSLLVKDNLLDHNIPVKMIRETDTAVGDTTLNTIAKRKRSDIQYRAQVVNEMENCVLVSIHQNFFEQKKYSGAQMFYSPNNSESGILAEAIRKEVVSQTQPENTRQNKQAEKGIYLLNNVNAPAVIVECGFLSNPEEAQLLNDSSYQKKIAKAIADGIIQYVNAE